MNTRISNSFAKAKRLRRKIAAARAASKRKAFIGPRLPWQHRKPDSKFFQIRLKVGDVVEATGKLWRRDLLTVMNPGDRATVKFVRRDRPKGPQIIGLKVEGQHFDIGDTVCLAALPLRFIRHKNDPEQ